MGEQPVHRPVLERFLPRVDNRLQEKVRLFQLVVEEAVVLAELEVTQVETVDGGGAKNVQAGKQPAAAGLFLVGTSLGLDHVAEMRINHHAALCVLGQHRQRSIVHGIAEGFVRGRSFIAFPNLGQGGFGESALLGHYTHTQQHSCKNKKLFHIGLFFNYLPIPAPGPASSGSRTPVRRSSVPPS